MCDAWCVMCDVVWCVMCDVCVCVCIYLFGSEVCGMCVWCTIYIYVCVWMCACVMCDVWYVWCVMCVGVHGIFACDNNEKNMAFSIGATLTPDTIEVNSTLLLSHSLYLSLAISFSLSHIHTHSLSRRFSLFLILLFFVWYTTPILALTNLCHPHITHHTSHAYTYHTRITHHTPHIIYYITHHT